MSELLQSHCQTAQGLVLHTMCEFKELVHTQVDTRLAGMVSIPPTSLRMSMNRNVKDVGVERGCNYVIVKFKEFKPIFRLVTILSMIQCVLKLVPYSGFLSWMKIFTNFVFLCLFTRTFYPRKSAPAQIAPRYIVTHYPGASHKTTCQCSDATA